MTIGELKKLIKKLPDDAEVYTSGVSRLKKVRGSAIRVEINKKLKPAYPSIVESKKDSNALLIIEE
jgi:hypothetical protein